MERIIGRNIRKAEIILINIIFNAWFLALCSILGFQNLNPIGFYYTEKSEKILFRWISSYKNSSFFCRLLKNELSMKHGFVLKGNYGKDWILNIKVSTCMLAFHNQRI